jgi:hypothetical protein
MIQLLLLQRVQLQHFKTYLKGSVCSFQAVADHFNEAQRGTLQRNNELLGWTTLAKLCPQEQSLPRAGGLYDCASSSGGPNDATSITIVEFLNLPTDQNLHYL